MRIEIIKSKETSLVIDDIGKAIEEGDILKEGYLKAIHALQRYLDQSRLIRDELKENFVGSMGENKGNYQYSSHDILDYLDDLRVMGNRAVFPTDRSSK